VALISAVTVAAGTLDVGVEGGFNVGLEVGLDVWVDVGLGVGVEVGVVVVFGVLVDAYQTIEGSKIAKATIDIIVNFSID
jgi:hypothetical protein